MSNTIKNVLELPVSPITEKEADKLTRAYTAFENFDALIFAKGDYRPTFKTTPATHRRNTKAEDDRCSDRLRLADAYDFAQSVLADPRRAYRY